ncbi:sugar ABC transporter substrate-binding protein [Ruminiclostridium cellulolyticum]|uniref:Periplasmic sugar-binding protein n=1 Tax=Ruminiclostridium cellulolyticum (strain ATCC 35319 / DSM 5812 / JCM 6584 / H10) TaxID=394503 RepID=B8I3W5_RUMCH|nr:substrate-binding domain-containing protein [Ruminiclostridium cellulolyticum]ACL74442.1 periplasmic sugar-binding protein [Ruminiclostridium cellulolyticum H10]
MWIKQLKIFLLLASLITMVLLAGCSYKNPIDKPDKITIGLSMATLQEERWHRDIEALRAKAQAKGAEILFRNANNNINDQISQVKSLLSKDIDILVIVPQDAEKSQQAVQLARNKGIRVICYDRLIKNSNTDFYVSFDNIRVGEYMASLMVSKVPKGNYILINGAKTDYNSFMYNKGFKNILGKYLYEGSIKIVDEVWANDWKPEDAFKCVDKALRDGKKIDAIIAANDSLAGAAIKALSQRRLAGKVPVAGHDADISGCQRVAEGTQLLTVYKPIDQLAEKAIDVVLGLLNNDYYACNKFINDGESDIPYEMVEPVVVTKDTLVDTVISAGFHKLEDVYRNVPESKWPRKK